MTDQPTRDHQIADRLTKTLSTMVPLRAMIGLGVLIAFLMAAGVLNRTGWIIGNSSPSVPRGLYIYAESHRAPYVTFCLGQRHRDIQVYPNLCSPDTPDAPRILKRIATRHADGSLTVAGDTIRALDSRFLGQVRPEETRGWWAPLLIERSGKDRSNE